MAYETILLERKGHTGLLTLNRPENLNSYNEAMHEDLRNAWQEINKDDNIWSIVVTGAGRAFCTGADMKEASKAMGKGQLGAPRWEAFSDTLGRFSNTSVKRVMGTGLPSTHLGYPAKPIISAINGICCGDGLAWVYSSDFCLCSDDATFFDPHVNVCIAPPGIYGLTRNAPRAVAFAIMFMGLYWRVDAKRAFELGMVTEVVPREQLVERALGLAEEMNTSSAPLAVRATKAYYWTASNMNFAQARLWARPYDYQVRFQTEDAQEARRALVEKRRPQWKAR